VLPDVTELDICVSPAADSVRPDEGIRWTRIVVEHDGLPVIKVHNMPSLRNGAANNAEERSAGCLSDGVWMAEQREARNGLRQAAVGRLGNELLKHLAAV